MSISSLQLEAFAMVAQMLHFSKAAEKLHLTQSALSQRIQNLEAALGLTLLVRAPRNLRLTEAGLRILRYCQTKEAMEQELLQDIHSKPKAGLGGVLRIAAFSSVLRSVLFPVLSEFLRSNPEIQIDFLSQEIAELPQTLYIGRADFIVMDYRLERSGIETINLGEEQYVLIESSSFKTRQDFMLDHDPEDHATEKFFRHQGGKLPVYRRGFVDDVYGILEGVALGLGRAVIPQHLIRSQTRVRVVKGFKTYRVPTVLHYHAKPFYTKLESKVTELLGSHCSSFLEVR